MARRKGAQQYDWHWAAVREVIERHSEGQSVRRAHHYTARIIVLSEMVLEVRPAPFLSGEWIIISHNMHFFVVPLFQPWIEPEDYAAFKRLVPNNSDLPETYDEWLDLATKEIADEQAMGFAVEKVTIHAFEFSRYCYNLKVVPNSAALWNFAFKKIRRPKD